MSLAKMKPIKMFEKQRNRSKTGDGNDLEKKKTI